MYGTKNKAALVLLDGQRFEGSARLVQADSESNFWIGTFRCVSVLFLGDLTKGLVLECGRSQWLVRTITTNIDDFATIRTCGNPLR